MTALQSDWHTHRRAQLLYASAGAMRFEGPDTMSLLPPSRAAFIPSGVPHRASCTRPVSLRTVYLDPAPGDPTVTIFTAPPLLPPLVQAICDLGVEPGARAEPVFATLRLFLVEWLRDPLPLRLPLPSSEPLRAVAERVLRRPGAPLSLADASSASGWSARTVQRRFVQETGVSFSEWLVQARLHHAIDLLADPAIEIGEVALRSGYASQASFTRAFRQWLGCTPSGWRAGAGSPGA